MFSFMFGVLGSFIFWGVYFLISLIAGTMIVKEVAPRTWKFISTGHRRDYELMLFEVLIIVLCIYTFWPIVSLYYLAIFMGRHLLWTPFCFIVNLVDKNIPKISIKRD